MEYLLITKQFMTLFELYEHYMNYIILGNLNIRYVNNQLN